MFGPFIDFYSNLTLLNPFCIIVTNGIDVRGDLLENNASIAVNERNEGEKAADKKAIRTLNFLEIELQFR